MTTPAARRLASAMHQRIRRSFEQWERAPELGVVRQLDPMRVELTSSHLDLEQGVDLMLGGFVRWYDANYGLRIDDVVVLMLASDALWVAFDVVNERDVGAGLRPLKPVDGAGAAYLALDASSDVTLTAAGTATDPQGGTITISIPVTGNHHIAKKMEVYDAAGTRVGWVPVYTDLP